jgi:acetyltransferase-like isoleucine patch superfamily enzyme
MNVTAAAVAALLRELGQLQALITAAGDDPGRIELAKVTRDAAAGPGDMAWSRCAEAAAGFRGALLLCPEAAEPGPDGAASAAPSSDAARPAAPVVPPAGTAIAVCANPRLAMAAVIEHFFGHLAADAEPAYADPALADAVARADAWVKNARVGRNVTIGAHAVIGCSGMGYERDADGRLTKFPQLGGVVIEDDVDVAAHATVQRGALGDTILRHGAKIGPHVNVGHGVDVGENVLIAGHAQVGGGARILRGATIWQSAVIANGVTVGEGAVIGMSAALRKDVGPGEVWAGNPARRLR